MGRDTLEDYSSNTYYIVEVTLRECKAFDGKILTEEGESAYLGWSDEGGGWPCITPRESWAKRFARPPDKKTVSQWDGMPWYCNIRKVSKIYEVTEEHRVTKKLLDKEV